MAAATLNIRYDRSMLRATGCTVLSDFQGFCNEKLASHIVGLSIAEVRGYTGDKALLDIEFEVLSELSEPVNLGIDVVTFADSKGVELPLLMPLANIPPPIPLFLPLIQK